jgi:hypothetical protein
MGLFTQCGVLTAGCNSRSAAQRITAIFIDRSGDRRGARSPQGGEKVRTQVGGLFFLKENGRMIAEKTRVMREKARGRADSNPGQVSTLLLRLAKLRTKIHGETIHAQAYHSSVTRIRSYPCLFGDGRR